MSEKPKQLVFVTEESKKDTSNDFIFELYNQVEYQNHKLRMNDLPIKIIPSRTQSIAKDLIALSGCNLVPVGSVEYVSSWLKLLTGTCPKPRNVPESLMKKKFTGREVKNFNEKDLYIFLSERPNFSADYFIKSNEKIKGFQSYFENQPIPKEDMQISTRIEIETEWRVFVFKDKVIDMKRYSGAIDIIPSMVKIEEMISAFSSESPCAYTLDVAVTDKKQTVVIEVHDFFSCGTYGFDSVKYPFMLSQWYFEYVRNNPFKTLSKIYRLTDGTNEEVNLDDEKTFDHLPKDCKTLENLMFKEIGQALVYMNKYYPEVYPKNDPQRIRINNYISHFAKGRLIYIEDEDTRRKWLQQQVFVFQDETENQC